MPDLIDVGDYNPYNVNLVPVEGNPFALQGDVGAAIQQQNAAEAQRRATAGGLLQHFMTPGNVAQGVQPETPGVMTEADAFRQNQLEDQARNFGTQQAFNTVFGNVPMSQAGALGVGGGGIKAYHGSPYDFEKFDLGKIGTGEGAQAYGHGLYFAENPAVAGDYKKTLAAKYTDLNRTQVTKEAADALGSSSKYLPWAILKELEEGTPIDNVWSKLSADPLTRGRAPQEINAAIDYVKQNYPNHAAVPGRMYEVNINADPEHFLDWDKPLSEQHPKVQEALAKAGVQIPRPPSLSMIPDPAIRGIVRKALQQNEGQARDIGLMIDNDSGLYNSTLQHAKSNGRDLSDEDVRAGDYVTEKANPFLDALEKSQTITGGKAVDSLASLTGDNLNNMGLDHSFASNKLREAGIPGIKYLDQGSRGSGQGTSNYVVFNDKLIDIIKKYGLAGLVAGGASHFTTTPVDHNPFAAQQ